MMGYIRKKMSGFKCCSAVKLAVIFFILLSLWRGHWNGIAFTTFFIAILMAYRFDLQSPKINFFPKELREKGLWKYGLRRAAGSLIWLTISASGMQEYKSYPHIRFFMVRYIGGIMLTAILLYGYLAVLMLLDLWDSEALAEVLHIINQPLQIFLEPYLRTEGRGGVYFMIDQLASHGYSDRIPLLFHASWVSMFAGIVLLFSLLPSSIEVIRTAHIAFNIALKKDMGKNDFSHFSTRLKFIFAGVLFGVMGGAIFSRTAVLIDYGDNSYLIPISKRFLVGHGYEESLALWEPAGFVILALAAMIPALLFLLVALYFPRRKTVEKYLPMIRKSRYWDR